MDFKNIDLKPMSWQILETLMNKQSIRAETLAEEMGLKTRQVDAAITKSLVRYGFVIRKAHLTKLMRKEYNLIEITERGKSYVLWRKESIN